MELKWLEDVLLLLQEGNFSKAAAKRHVTQPAFSRRIRNVENWLGARIVDRSTQPVTIPHSAWRIEPEIRALAKRTKELKACFRAASQNSRQIEFAAQHSLSVSVVPTLMCNIRDHFPDTYFRLRSANFEQCITLCLTGDVDLMIGYEHPKQKSRLPALAFDKIVWGTEQLIPVVGGGLRCQLRADQQLPEHIPLLSYPEDSFMGEALGQSVLPEFLNDHDPQFVCQTGFALSMRNMCLTGLGMAWLPASLIRRDLEMRKLVSLSENVECCLLETVIYSRKSEPFAQEICAYLSASLKSESEKRV